MSIQQCRLCPLIRRASNKVLTWEPETYDIVIINGCPTTSNKGQPFTYTQNKYLETVMRKAGVSKWTTAITNLLRCPSDGVDIKSGKRKEAIQHCSQEISSITSKAKVIIGLGEETLQYYTGKKNINLFRGSVFKLPTGQYYIGALSFLAYLKSVMGNCETDRKSALPLDVTVVDFKRAKMLVEGSLKLELVENFSLNPDKIKLEQLLERCYSKGSKVVSVDIETLYYKGQHIKEATPLTISFGWDDWGIALIFEQHLPTIIQALRSPVGKVFQNGIFDVMVLNNSLMKVNNWVSDTMYMHHLLLAELPHRMSFLQSIYTTMPYHKDMVSFIGEEEI